MQSNMNVLLLIVTIFVITNASTLSALAIPIENTSKINQVTNNSTLIREGNTIPSAESVYANQSLSVPSSVKTFVWYIVDEAHENLDNGMHKHVSDHNPIYLPTDLILQQGTSLVLLDADAPWDTPHPHSINIINGGGNVVYTTGKLDYTNSSAPTVLPLGEYSIVDTKYKWMVGHVTVIPNQQKTTGDLIAGGFYTPTNEVADKTDNVGGVHPGWLGYYKSEFPRNGFDILSTFNFHYATCSYCPNGYWPDQKAADHTLLIYSTNQPLSDALNKLSKFVWDNVYI